jgi:hypothetical protein
MGLCRDLIGQRPPWPLAILLTKVMCRNAHLPRIMIHFYKLFSMGHLTD